METMNMDKKSLRFSSKKLEHVEQVGLLLKCSLRCSS